MSFSSYHLVALFALPFLIVGCSGRPGRVEQPRFNASTVGSDALELYDTDGDGRIAGAELDASPPLKNEMELIDTDKDGGISADEIAARVDAWKSQKTGLLNLSCSVAIDGKPAANVLVKYVPEPFLADILKTAEGLTGQSGGAIINVPKEDRPTADTPSGVPMGFYRVTVEPSQGGRSVPSRYLSFDSTSLGHEVSYDNKAVLHMGVRHKLTSK